MKLDLEALAPFDPRRVQHIEHCNLALQREIHARWFAVGEPVEDVPETTDRTMTRCSLCGMVACAPELHDPSEPVSHLL